VTRYDKLMIRLSQGGQASGLPVWVGLSCASDASGEMYLQAGETNHKGTVKAGDAATLSQAIDVLQGKDVPLLSIMHTDVRHIAGRLEVLEASWSGIVGVYAHSGEYIDEAWNFEGTISPDDFATAREPWLEGGVQPHRRLLRHPARTRCIAQHSPWRLI